MVDFRPFRGVRYAPSAGPVSDLVCPPYDVISPALERRLLDLSPYNMVRLELAEVEGARDAAQFASAASAYRSWLTSGVLRADDDPAYYLLRQRFAAPGGGPPVAGAMSERYAVFGALRLEELGTGVLPHEDTGAAAKDDRRALMEATAANFSPLLMLYQDDGTVAEVRNRTMAATPDAEAAADGEELALWRIDGEDDRTAIMLALGSKQVFIADGHHRYETALGYSKDHAGPAAQFVMTALVSFDDAGLAILPYDRVVHGLDPAALGRVREQIAALFAVQPAALAGSSSGPLEELVAQEGARGIVFGMVGPGGEGPYLLTLIDPSSLDRFLPSGMEPSVREIEAWVLQEAILRPALGDGFASHVTAMHDGAAALTAVTSGDAQLAFFLKGVPTDLFERVVSAGARLPRKSTYFWPKLPSGLVINSLQDEP